MRVRFWGTRGSIPVALTSAAVKTKLVAALVRAAGRTLDTPDKARAFVDEELDFAVSHTFGGNSSCVEIETDGGAEYVLCDLGSGARAFGNHVLADARGRRATRSTSSCPTCTGTTSWGFRSSCPPTSPGNRIRIYGCHAELEEAFRRQNAAPSFPVDFSRLGAAIEFVRLEPGRDYEIGGPRGDAPSSSGTAATPTATGSRGTARSSSTRPTPSTSSTTRRRRRGSSSSSRAPTSSSSTPCTRSPTPSP